MSILSLSKHTGIIRIRFIYLYCLVIVVDNDQSIFGLANPFSYKFVALKLISYPISILLLYSNSGINSRIPSIAQFMDLGFSCLVWSCEASGKAQTSIETPPEICCLVCFADEARTPVARTLGTLGHFIKSQKASLEIFPTGEYIVDAIVVPFV